MVRSYLKTNTQQHCGKRMRAAGRGSGRPCRRPLRLPRRRRPELSGGPRKAAPRGEGIAKEVGQWLLLAPGYSPPNSGPALEKAPQQHSAFKGWAEGSGQKRFLKRRFQEVGGKLEKRDTQAGASLKEEGVVRRCGEIRFGKDGSVPWLGQSQTPGGPGDGEDWAG